MKATNTRDHIPYNWDQFYGLYARGVYDNVPKGYFIDCLNVAYESEGVKTRNGFSTEYTKANLIRTYRYKRLGETSRFIALDTSGNLFDSLYGSPITTNALWVDFSAVTINNHLYITFHNRVTGNASEKIWIYDGGGPGTLRPAAGAAPIGFTITAATSASAGNIEQGTHIIAVAYKTASGHITVPGPTLFTVYNAPGGFRLDLSGVAAGPSGTVSRMILMTQSIQDYNNDQFGYEFFFAGEIGDNSTTIITLNLFDADLIDSADYLFDLRTELPAGTALINYGNRLGICGVPSFERYVFFSIAGQPESIDDTAGTILIDSSESVSGIINMVDHRGDLHLYSNTKTFISRDNGSDPNTWPVDPIDKSVGTECFGISRILDSKGSNIDRYFVGSRSGLYVFESGVFRKREASYNIADVWARINKTYFNKINVDHDPENYKIYVSVPLDNATSCSHMLVADYSTAIVNNFINTDKIKWAIWSFAWGNIASILVDYDSNKLVKLRVAATAGNIYIEDPNNNYLDNVTVIPSYFRTNLVYDDINAGKHHYGLISINGLGAGNMTVTMFGMNNTKITSLPVLVLTAAPSKPFYKKNSFTSSKASVKFSTGTNAGDYFNINDATIDVKVIMGTGPM